MENQIYFTLREGEKIPSIGFGPGIMGYNAGKIIQKNKVKTFIDKVYNRIYYNYHQKQQYTDSISNALKMGYRLLDYSNAYGNLDLIQNAIDKSGISRNNLFLTCRFSNKAQINKNIRDQFVNNLKEWKTDYIDLLQFHWPVTDHYIDTWKEMIRLKEEGKVKILGVANCHIHHLEKLEKETGVLPEINQIEVHPLFTQKKLINECKERGIIVEAYTPVARYDDRLVRLPLLKDLENKYGKNFIQIILRWHIQNGVIPVIRSLNSLHQKLNFDIFDFEIEKEDMEKIDNININSRLRYDPDNCDFSIL